jgi:hypothetical protein
MDEKVNVRIKTAPLKVVVNMPFISELLAVFAAWQTKTSAAQQPRDGPSKTLIASAVIDDITVCGSLITCSSVRCFMLLTLPMRRVMA